MQIIDWLTLVIKGAQDSNLQWDFEVYGLEVHIAVVHCKRSIWDLEFNLVIEVQFVCF